MIAADPTDYFQIRHDQIGQSTLFLCEAPTYLSCRRAAGSSQEPSFSDMSTPTSGVGGQEKADLGGLQPEEAGEEVLQLLAEGRQARQHLSGITERKEREKMSEYGRGEWMLRLGWLIKWLTVSGSCSTASVTRDARPARHISSCPIAHTQCRTSGEYHHSRL